MKIQANRRRGGAALVALVSLSIITLILVGLLRVNAARTGQIRQNSWRCQADWLVEAGLERAALLVSHDPSYEGETWSIPASSLGGRAGTVTITIRGDEAPEGEPLSVEVQADYPSDGSLSDRVRRRKTFGIAPKFNLEEPQ